MRGVGCSLRQLFSISRDAEGAADMRTHIGGVQSNKGEMEFEHPQLEDFSSGFRYTKLMGWR